LHRALTKFEHAGFAARGIPFAAIMLSIPFMTLQQFRAASCEMQEKLVKQKGVFLMERKSLGVSVLLFQVDGFYVEVFYNASTTSVSFIKSFDDMDGIEAYLTNIDISAVMAIL
jgi:hypothetical protein